MDDQPLPYFFPEALRVIKRLNERERQRGITEKDREFLRNLFLSMPMHARRKPRQ